MLDVLEHIEKAQDFMDKVRKLLKMMLLLEYPFQSLLAVMMRIKTFQKIQWMKETDVTGLFLKKDMDLII